MSNLNLNFNEVEDGQLYVGGLHHEWLTLETETESGEAVECRVTSGAGLGNATLGLLIKVGENRHEFNINMGEQIKELVAQFLTDQAA